MDGYRVTRAFGTCSCSPVPGVYIGDKFFTYSYAVVCVFVCVQGKDAVERRGIPCARIGSVSYSVSLYLIFLFPLFGHFSFLPV